MKICMQFFLIINIKSFCAIATNLDDCVKDIMPEKR
jgi:hypothetical protein